MASKKKTAPVKCLYCGQTFSRDLEEYVQVNSRRYAHKICYDRHNSELSQEQRDLEALNTYIKKLFNIDTLGVRIQKQIQSYHDDKNFTYSGILKSLTYFFQVKGNSIDKANGGIGIVPYVYEDARNYYTAIWMAQQQNQSKPIEQWKPEIVEVHIPPPKRKKQKNTRFSFLDEGED